MESKKWHYAGPIRICAGPIVGIVDDQFLIKDGIVNWKVCAIGEGARGSKVESIICSGTRHNVSEARREVENFMNDIKIAIEKTLNSINKDE